MIELISCELPPASRMFPHSLRPVKQQTPNFTLIHTEKSNNREDVITFITTPIKKDKISFLTTSRKSSESVKT